MIIKNDIQKTVSSHNFDSVSFGIDEADLAHIFEMLRNHYSNKSRAIVREYSCNAFDAHVDSGQTDRPIEITLPTNLNPSFEVRDFGAGLSEDGIKNVFAFYGKSTKRGSNSQIGSFGIGAKSAFCYSDSFLVVSYHGGKKSIYNCFLDESGLGRIAVMNVEDSTEPTGIQIIVPVKPADINLFLKEAAFTFNFFKVKPVIANASTGYSYDYINKLIPQKGTPLFIGTGWRLYNSDTYAKSYVVMGNVPYPIDYESIGMQSEIVQELLNCQLEIDIDMGGADILSTRESLKYTDRTKKMLISKIEGIVKEIELEIGKQFSTAKNIWDAKILFQNFFNSNNILGRIFRNHRHVLNLAWNGVPINSRYIRVHDDFKDTVKVKRYSVRQDYTSRRHSRRGYSGGYSGYCYSISREDITQIDAAENHALVFDDGSGQIEGKVYTKCKVENQAYVYLISTTDNVEYQKFLAESHLDAVPMINLTDIVPTKYEDGQTKVAYEVSAEAKAKVLEYDYQSSHYAKLNWKVAEVDLNTETGVYVTISRFYVEQCDGLRFSTWGRADNTGFRDYVVEWQKLGILDKPVYGFKPILTRNVKANPKSKKAKNWVHLPDYIKAKVEAEIKTKNLAQFIAIKSIVDSHPKQFNFFDWLAKAKVTSNGLAKEMITKYTKMFKTLEDKEINRLITCAKNIGISLTPDAKVSDEMVKDFDAVIAEYPLLKHLNGETNVLGDLPQYVALVDKK
jgi:hypothetical protein